MYTDNNRFAGSSKHTAYVSVSWTPNDFARPSVHLVFTFGCLVKPNSWVDGIALLQPVPNLGTMALAVESFNIFYADGCIPRAIAVAELTDGFLDVTTNDLLLDSVHVLCSEYEPDNSHDASSLVRYHFLGLTAYMHRPTNVSCLDADIQPIPCFDKAVGMYAVMLCELLDTTRSAAA